MKHQILKKITNSLLAKILIFFISFSLTLFSFQNCSNNIHFTREPDSISTDVSSNDFCSKNPDKPECQSVPEPVCKFDDEIILEGRTVDAYLSSTVPYLTQCEKEVRKCQNGALTGSYNFRSCEPGAPESCLFQGETISHNRSTKRFQNSTVPFGSTCKEEQRVCNNGKLSGSFEKLSCGVDVAKDCSLKGVPIKHGESKQAFFAMNPEFGVQCKSEIRQCINGQLTGSYEQIICNPGQPKACILNDSTQPIPHGGSITTFQNSSVKFGQTCTSEKRICNDGLLMGSFRFTECNVGVGSDCELDGEIVRHNTTVATFEFTTVPYGQVCKSQDRTCFNGTFNGSATYSKRKCRVDDAKDCDFNGRTTLHNASEIAFEASTVPFNQTCKSESIKCINGVFTGTFRQPNCNPGAERMCNFNGKPYAPGQILKVFLESTVSYDKECAVKEFVCRDGSFPGLPARVFESCNKLPPPEAKCGSASGIKVSTPPTTNLCLAGTNESVQTEAEKYKWICKNGPSNINCEAPREINGSCGTANNTVLTTAPTTNLCSSGQSTVVTTTASGYAWKCGTNDSTPADCSAQKPAVCGSAHGQNSEIAPNSSLCFVGNSSLVITETDNFKWSCNNGSSKADCNSPKIINGVCGSSNGRELLDAPNENLCLSGQSTAVTTTDSGYVWKCGTRDLTPAECKATKLTNTGFINLPSSVVEGSRTLFEFMSSAPNGTKFRYEIKNNGTGTQLNNFDFVTALTGFITVSNGKGQLFVETKEDHFTEGQEVFNLTVYNTDGTTGSKGIVIINDTSLNIVGGAIQGADFINESAGPTTYTMAVDLPDGVKLNYYISELEGKFVPENDIKLLTGQYYNLDRVTGEAIVHNGAISFAIDANSDLLTEGNEKVKLKVTYRSPNAEYDIQSKVITINDDSKNITSRSPITGPLTIRESDSYLNPANVCTAIYKLNVIAPENTEIYYSVVPGLTQGINPLNDLVKLSGQSANSTSLSGKLTVRNGQVPYFCVDALSDFLSEGDESAIVKFSYKNLEKNYDIATQNITIIDDSNANIRALGTIQGPETIKETNKSYSVYTLKVDAPNGTLLRCDGSSELAIASDPVANGVATCRVLSYADLYTDGDKAFKIQFKFNNTNIGDAKSVTIIDDSKSITSSGGLIGPATLKESAGATNYTMSVNAPDETELYYTITSVVSDQEPLNASDLELQTGEVLNENKVKGMVKVQSGQVSLRLDPKADLYTEGNEAIQVQFGYQVKYIDGNKSPTKYNVGGSSQITLIDDSVNLLVTGSTLSGPSSISENSLANEYSMNVTAPEGTILNYSVIGTGTKPATFQPNSTCDLVEQSGQKCNGIELKGTAVVVAGKISFKIAARADFLTEGDETAQVTVYYRNPLNNLNYHVVGQPKILTLTDDSKTQTIGTVSTSQTVFDEGSVVTFNISTTNVTTGTQLNYTLSGIGITSSDINGAPLSGKVTINNNVGSLSVTLKAADGLEGNELLKFEFTLPDGTKTSTTVTIRDK